jgi:hypothetical protein
MMCSNPKLHFEEVFQEKITLAQLTHQPNETKVPKAEKIG